ncbi:MAG: hypothetical protein II852_01275 [Bacteroidales bacterium]|nr:hypothetical protein [Bacteroidales bacterium]
MLTLTSILSTPESSYLEGKSAKGGFPDSFWESYSAFANIRFGERAGSGLNGIVYVWKKVYHTDPEIFVKEEYDRTFLKLPTLGKEPDVEAMAEFYPDEEETSDNGTVNANDPENVTVNGQDDPINGTVNDPIKGNGTINGTINDIVKGNGTLNGTLNGTVNDPVKENGTINGTINDTVKENGTLNDTLKSQIIEMIRVNPNVNAFQLIKLLNKSLRQIRRLLAKLQAEGTIRRVGADKNGHWEIINNQLNN